ncbi:MFS transporter [Rhodovarius crocodyli]|uniref:MFS transporter n=1 Tax=Rhodovarius crocodyli TaxID=1979269 RepID=A0A437MPE8_9PROT|nr:MFS transporter [Rhodovarius crocodyli]RVT99508.1 MFS transporter [Rhodovarius crocodyli]
MNANLRVLAHILAALTLGITQGLGDQFVTANQQTIQGHFSVTSSEAAWLVAAYSATRIPATLLLYKARTQYGLRVFTELGLAVYAVMTLLHLVVRDFDTMVMLRAAAGFAAAPLSTLALLYCVLVLTERFRLSVGLSIGLLGSQITPPLARLISPYILDRVGWDGLVIMECGLALLSLAVVLMLKLPEMPRSRVFGATDAISFPLLAGGIGLVSMVLTLGRFYWWLEAPWLGWCLAMGVLLLALVCAIEINRKQPMLELRFMMQPTLLLFAGTMLAARLVMAEPVTGAVGFFQNLGLLNDNMAGLQIAILSGTLAGTAISCVFCSPDRAHWLHMAGLAVIGTAAWIESGSTSVTRPPDFYLPQAMIAFGTALFLPAAMAWSLAWVMRTNPTKLMGYIAMFLGSQVLGAQIGSALLGSFVIIREKFHSAQVVAHLTLQDPLVVQRAQQYGAAYRPVLGDTTLQSAEGLVRLGQLATREAYVLAYDDLFLTVSAAAALMLLGLLTHRALVALRGLGATRTA